MAAKPLPSQEVLRQLLRYEPETGKLFWRERSVDTFTSTATRSAGWKARNWNSKLAGHEAFAVPKPNGYLHGNLTLPGCGKQNLYAHRVIWKMVMGSEPEFVDHINGDRADNRISNLRAVTKSENCRNARPSGRTGRAVGVHKSVTKGKWCAVIGIGDQSIHLGTFDTFDEAYSARKQAERHHGFHPNHGIDPCANTSGSQSTP